MMTLHWTLGEHLGYAVGAKIRQANLGLDDRAVDISNALNGPISEALAELLTRLPEGERHAAAKAAAAAFDRARFWQRNGDGPRMRVVAECRKCHQVMTERHELDVGICDTCKGG